MAGADHRYLSTSEVHEPKHISSSSTTDTGKVITPSSITGGTSELRKLTPQDISHSDKTKNVFGWNDISDNNYTSGSPLSLTSGVRTQITNNGAAAQSDTSRLGGIWSTGSNSFTINDLYALYNLRFNLKATTASPAGTPYTLVVELESASGPTVIASSTRIVKGGGAISPHSIILPFYVGTVVNNQALKIYVTSDTNMSVYDFGFLISRDYTEV